MPHLFSFAGHGNEDALQELEHEPQQKFLRRPSLLKNIGSLLRRHHEQIEPEPFPQTAPTEHSGLNEYFPVRRRSWQDTSSPNRRAIPSLPRPQTFRRQESERRERLLEVEPSPTERRAVSVDRRRGFSVSGVSRPRSPKPASIPSVSAPDVGARDPACPSGAPADQLVPNSPHKSPRHLPTELPPLQIPDSQESGPIIDEQGYEDDIDRTSLQEEYDRRWILNLSMHFRDKSNREKFFVTYAETPSNWRRLTVSLDYRNAPEGSLEADLSTLHYQRDKSFRIYEAIRESLPEIQYYSTVTNLKLETTPDDGQLHVHVREDANETIQYPSKSLFEHVRCQRYAESELEFMSHLSGFVYKVRAEGRIVIKKEIPGPDTIDEFIYEVNALDSLLGCDNVVQLVGLVTDDAGSSVKGLLISYASQGALVDMLYDFRGTPELPWHRREKWAKQIVQGLAEIHEAGFVQGDFTLSNIVIDEHDNAQIIDINRRGCPVGWEPPELGKLIDSGQRIGMCIGVKTDLFQLGMVLWALAEEIDEPEREERPLPPVKDYIPTYFRKMVQTCLSSRPQGRIGAKTLLRSFPQSAGIPTSPVRPSVDFIDHLKLSDNSITSHRSDKEYIDPDLAVTLDEVRLRRSDTGASDFTSGQVTYVDPVSNPASSNYRFDSSGSWVVGHRRGRSPVSSRRRRSSPFARPASSATSQSSASSPKRLERSRAQYRDTVDEGKAAEPTVTVPHLTELEAGDMEPPPALETRSQATEELQLPPLLDRKLSVLQDEHISRLVHTDSGFDEEMPATEHHQPNAMTDASQAPIQKNTLPVSGCRPLQPRNSHDAPTAVPSPDPQQDEGDDTRQI